MAQTIEPRAIITSSWMLARSPLAWNLKMLRYNYKGEERGDRGKEMKEKEKRKRKRKEKRKKQKTERERREGKKRKKKKKKKPPTSSQKMAKSDVQPSQ